MQRYNIITSKPPREIVLLKGYPCIYQRCAFCNYTLDNTRDESLIDATNTPIINLITGQYGVLEVINSGSALELSQTTIMHLQKIVAKTKIHTIFFEAYVSYINQLDIIRDAFPEKTVHFRIGIETFDDKYRNDVLKKNFSLTKQIANTNETLFERIKANYSGVLLLVCTKGQTREQITADIAIALANFTYVTISVFVNNNTAITRDEKLVSWFITDIFPTIKDHPRIEILIDNKDFGVYVQ